MSYLVSPLPIVEVMGAEMRWPRRKQKVNLAKDEAVQAAREAQKRLTETREQWSEIRALTDRLAYIRERNHLSEAIREAIVGGEE